ncbi:fibronectin type III domain protein [Trichuris suis]|nr:fibronectin type III domain protein [Trichuris suis]
MIPILAGARDKVMHTLVTKQNECLLENLCSFTAYSIKLTLSLGKKKCSPINLLVVTEPETSPQNISIKAIDSKSVFLRWSSPCKSKNIVKAYAIYYSNHLPNAFENWQKKIVSAEERSSLITDLENPEDYYFCMSSVYETYHSPLSKPICIAENPSVKPVKKSTHMTGESKLSSCPCLVFSETYEAVIIGLLVKIILCWKCLSISSSVHMRKEPPS